MKTFSRLTNRIQAMLMALFVAVAFASVYHVNPIVPALILLGLSFLATNKKGYAYDSLVVSDTTYAGTFAPYYILPAIWGMDTVRKGAIFVQDGIKKSHTIGKIDFTAPWQPRIATPVQSGGNITVTGNVLTPADMMLYQEINPRDLEVHWEAEKLSPSLLTREIPPTFENYITALIVGRALEQSEVQIWMGSTQYVGSNPASANYQLQFFDGILCKIIGNGGSQAGDATVYQTASPVTLTTATIGAAMLDLYQAVATHNKALLTNPMKYERLKFLVSVNTDLIYEDFLTTQTFKNNDTTEKGIRKYKGFEIVPLAGLPDNTIMFTEALSATDGNLWLGLNSILDENFQLARKLPASELFFVKMLMKMDVNYGFSNKIFLYTTLTSANFQ